MSLKLNAIAKGYLKQKMPKKEVDPDMEAGKGDIKADLAAQKADMNPDKEKKLTGKQIGAIKAQSK